MKKLKIAFIGGGLSSTIGRAHISAIQIDGLAEIVAGAFSSKKNVNLKSGRYLNIQRNRLYEDWRDLIKNEQSKIDAVIVLTPTPMHFEIIKQLIINNIPAVCEKPIVTNFKDIREINKLQKKYKSFVSVMYNYTGYPLVREIRKKLQKNLIGKIEYFNFEMPQDGFISKNKLYSVKEWRKQDLKIPNLCFDLGVHLNSLLKYILDIEPIFVLSDFSYFSNMNVVDNINILLQCENNIKGSFWFSKRAAGSRNDLKLRIYGEKGSIIWSQKNSEKIIYSNNKNKIEIIDRAGKNFECNKKRYNRYRPGHPSGFIEAFANTYFDIFQNLQYYKINKQKSIKDILNLNHAEKTLRLFDASFLSNKKKSWIKIKK